MLIIADNHIIRPSMEFKYMSQGFKLGATKTMLLFPFPNGIQYSALSLG